jgi:hypothetical protein
VSGRASDVASGAAEVSGFLQEPAVRSATNTG